MSAANIIDQSEQQDDYPEFPAWLRVENRQPLTPEQQARVDAAMAQASQRTRARADLRAMQLVTRKEKARVRIEKLLARKSGAAARMPLSGRAALLAINQTNCPSGQNHRGAAGRGRKKRGRRG